MNMHLCTSLLENPGQHSTTLVPMLIEFEMSNRVCELDGPISVRRAFKAQSALLTK